MNCSASATLWTRCSRWMVLMSGRRTVAYVARSDAFTRRWFGDSIDANTRGGVVMEQNRSRRQAPERSDTEVSEAQIAVHWQEENYFSAPKDFTAQANLTDKGVFKRFALEKFPGCYKEFAELLDWYKKWDKIFDGSKPPFWRWFVGGKINASYNCVDRHLAKHRNKAAIHFVPEPEHEAIQHVTYQELYVRVNEFAALLRDFCGLKAGDRVTLHMPMVAELPITMLACARLGVIHSQVFSGFSGKACADRVSDSESRVLITMDAYYRGGRSEEHTSELQSRLHLVCRLLLEKKKTITGSPRLRIVAF